MNKYGKPYYGKPFPMVEIVSLGKSGTTDQTQSDPARLIQINQPPRLTRLERLTSTNPIGFTFLGAFTSWTTYKLFLCCKVLLVSLKIYRGKLSPPAETFPIKRFPEIWNRELIKRLKLCMNLPFWSGRMVDVVHHQKNNNKNLLVGRVRRDIIGLTEFHWPLKRTRLLGLSNLHDECSALTCFGS